MHIATATIGFGTLALSGGHSAAGRHLRTRVDLGDLRRYFGRPNRSGKGLWAVPVTGGLALWLHHGTSALGQTWAVAAIGCWATATVLAVTVIWPAEHRIGVIDNLLGDVMVDEAPDLTELGRSCRPVVGAAAVAT